MVFVSVWTSRRWVFNAVAMATLVSLMVFNALFRYLGVDGLAYGLTALVFIVNAIALLLRGRIRRAALPVLVFCGAGIVPAFIAIRDVGWPIAVAGMVGAYGYLIVWWLCLEGVKNYAHVAYRYARLHIWLGATTAVFAILQYFWSSDLFGLVPGRTYTDAGLISIGFTKRATSLIGSPQNLGIYMALACVCVAIAVKGRLVRALLWLVMIAAGITSGSAAFVLSGLLVVGAYAYRSTQRSIVRAILTGSTCAVLVVGVLVAQRVDDIGNTAFGALDFGNPLEDYLPYYTQLIRYENQREVLFGHGLGLATRVSEVLLGQEFLPDTWRASESYVATVFYEMGLTGLLAFALLFFAAVFRCLSARGAMPTALLAILAVLFANLVITPSFTGLTMSAIAWPFILIPLLDSRQLTSTVSVPQAAVRPNSLSSLRGAL